MLSLIQDYPSYEKNAYIALAMSFVGLNDYKTAIRQLSKGLSKFPKFKDAYLARGQLLAHQKIWDKAISDFYKVISTVPEDGKAYVSLAEALKSMGDIPNALRVLSSAARCKNSIGQAYFMRGKIFYEKNSFKRALKEINKAIQSSPLEPEPYYYKALILLSFNNLSEAALCLEQVVKYDSNKKLVGAAIYDLGAIKIKQKDYYGAMHTFQRAIDLKIEVKEQKILKTYVEAILTLMKRKFKEGASLLTKIIKNKHPLIEEYIGNCYSFRAYAYAAQELHEKAIKDLNLALKHMKLDSASEFNYSISQGVVLIEKKPEQAITFFEKAFKIYPKNSEPYIYKACVYYAMRFNDKSKSMLEKALELKPGDSDIHFFRAIVNYYEGLYADSVQDLEIAIDKSEDNNVYHYMCRGLCYAQLEMYTEAVNDFSAVIQLDENLTHAFLYRGRCAFLLEESDLAYGDFQKLLYTRPEDPEVHLYAGDLLYLTHCLEDAIKAYTNSISKQYNKQAMVNKINGTVNDVSIYPQSPGCNPT